jgi:hypothetical protein
MMLCAALLFKPGWVHYFAALPLGHALLLEHAEGRWSVLSLLTASFSLSALPLAVCLFAPTLFSVVEYWGLVTLSGLCCLAGLWLCEPQPSAAQ